MIFYDIMIGSIEKRKYREIGNWMLALLLAHPASGFSVPDELRSKILELMRVCRQQQLLVVHLQSEQAEPFVTAQTGEPVIWTTTWDGFANTELECALREADIDHVLLCGDWLLCSRRGLHELRDANWC